MAFKLETLKYENSAELHLMDPSESYYLYDTEGLDPSDESKPVTVTIYGSASPQFKKALSVLDANKKARRGVEPSAAVAKKENTQFLVSLTAGFNGLEYKGELLDSPEQYAELYEDSQYSWVVNQISKFIGGSTSFLKK